ncbi:MULTISPECIES: hypothetical protein [Providencia]|uniref:Uncharacterized protein n=1 Tax=Providencia alcalifaciens 205/92 TaxID=1256988 RepID=A0AAV3M9Y6_9GAMM|nr:MULTISPECIES: hypothetical protein [Providencia]EUD05322.1 hypothetical protein HMPREF1564_0080 [Providencia alcalifaciens R90-1475]EUD12568.1 hypothetical protein HMPREF1563_2463 [Providencia alcalifaciens 205/92]MBF0691788.1 hypothetical protein [Providencia alcalifaciens]MTC15275.1 hypothetical protein [Providencia alcalifaciens]MTC30924.1 hypothetical protein [Providencia alcalifaciens]
MGVQYFQVKLIQCDYKHVSPMGMVRLITSDKVFFFNAEDFENSQIFLERLQKDDTLIISAEQLNDGSYWLNWVYHPEYGRLEPDRNLKFDKGLVKQYLLSLGLTALFIPAYFCLFTDEDSVWLIVIASLLAMAAFTGAVLLYMCISQTFTIFSRKRKTILRALDLVIDGKFQVLSGENLIQIEGIKNPKSKPLKINPTLDKLPPEPSLSVTKGNVNLKNINIIEYYYRGNTTIRHEVELQVNKSHLNLKLDGAKPFFNNHSFFLAQGDEVEVYHSKLAENQPDNVVFGVFNYQDNLAYTLSARNMAQERGLYLGLWWITGIILALLLAVFGAISIMEIQDRGGHWDSWDWLYLLDNDLIFIGFASSITLGICFLIALGMAAYYQFSKRGRAYYQTQAILSTLRRQQGKDGYVMEVR